MKQNARTIRQTLTAKEKAIELFSQHFNHLVLYVNQYTYDINVSEDIVQDLFARLWEQGKLSHCTIAFLYICAKNDVLNYVRDHHEYVSLDNVQDFGVKEKNIEDIMMHMEHLEEIRQAIDRLPPQCQTVLRKIYYENKHYAEVAAEMGISTNTVKTHVYLAIKTLKKNFTLYILLLIT